MIIIDRIIKFQYKVVYTFVLIREMMHSALQLYGKIENQPNKLSKEHITNHNMHKHKLNLNFTQHRRRQHMIHK